MLYTYMINTHFESKFAAISFDPEQGYMLLQINGYIEEKAFQEVLTKAMNYFARLNVNKVLNDFRVFKGTTPAMQQWVVQCYYPTLVKQGLTHGALVLSSDVFAKYAAKNV